MGAMQDTLSELLGTVGTVTHKTLPLPRQVDVAGSSYAGEVLRVYRELGGRLKQFPLRLGGWDMEFNGMAVELDEYLHFNRYRAITLESNGYEELPAFPRARYQSYSSLHEARCLKAGGYGGKWTNPSCEKQFGMAGPLRNLSGPGAPRWKQRAFYDFVKDLSPLVIRVPVVRIAIWDTIEDSTGQRTVEEALKAPAPSSSDALASLIADRGANH